MAFREDHSDVGIHLDNVSGSDHNYALCQNGHTKEGETVPIEVVEALRCLTKLSKDEPYEKFIKRNKEKPIGCKG
jgi:hypothetical protein